jgi:hypothetical protein
MDSIAFVEGAVLLIDHFLDRRSSTDTCYIGPQTFDFDATHRIVGDTCRYQARTIILVYPLQ